MARKLCPGPEHALFAGLLVPTAPKVSRSVGREGQVQLSIRPRLCLRTFFDAYTPRLVAFQLRSADRRCMLLPDPGTFPPV